MKVVKVLSIVIAIAFSGNLYAQKTPYPKIKKLADAGSYESCLAEAKEKLTKSEGADRQWLYGIMSYCQLQIFEKKGSQNDDLLKKSLSYAVNMKKIVAKSNGTDYSEDQFFSEHFTSLKTTLIKRIGEGNFESAEFTKTIQQCELVFGDQIAVTIKIAYFEANDEFGYMVDALKDLVVDNYRSRKTGDTTNLLGMYFKLSKALVENGEVLNGLDVLVRAAETYSTPKNIYNSGFAFYYEAVPVGMLSKGKVYNSWLSADSFFKVKLPEKKDSLLEKVMINYHLKLLHTLTDYNPDYDEYALSVKQLNNKFTTKYPVTYFEKELLQNHSDLFETKDSFMLGSIMDLQQLKTNTLKLNYCSTWIKKLLDSGYFLYTNNTYLFIKRHFKTQVAEVQKIKAQIDKYSLSGIDKNLFKGDFTLAVQYLKDNPNDKVTYKKVLDFTISKINSLILVNDYSQCMRITKTMNPFLMKEAAFQNAVFQWKKADYNYNYESLKSGFSFSGEGTNIAACKPGVISDANNTKFLRVLNYYRRTAGLFDSCILNKNYNQYAQAAALIMSANSHLTHSPAKSDKCYTENGYNGASHSNLSLGADGVYGMVIQMQDDGASNTSVGHRRWILYPGNTVFGLGSAEGAMALYVLGNEQIEKFDKRNPFNSEKEYVAWPAPGHFPEELLTTRWSFSMSGVNFDKATVTITSNGVTKAGVVESRNGSYGLSTLVWNVGDMNVKKSIPVTVLVENIQKYDYATGTTKKLSYQYQFMLF